MMSFFNDRDNAEAIITETHLHAKPRVTLEETASKFHRLVADAMRQYALISRDYRRMPSLTASRRPQPEGKLLSRSGQTY
ncbi:MAG: hypothetical protein CVV18_02370 [Gammaproteobacteria bacterium HGW-Gammaproteobacteria-8]|nr:MAG: hypothetical protein CVV18_02370 [Gammaproteobacteria bacterium HGW-Gammaproteobacteria-8]